MKDEIESESSEHGEAVKADELRFGWLSFRRIDTLRSMISMQERSLCVAFAASFNRKCTQGCVPSVKKS